MNQSFRFVTVLHPKLVCHKCAHTPMKRVINSRCTKRMAAVKCIARRDCRPSSVPVNESLYVYFECAYVHGKTIKQWNCIVEFQVRAKQSVQQSFFELFVVSLLSIFANSFVCEKRLALHSGGASQIRERKQEIFRWIYLALGLTLLGLTAINVNAYELWYWCACGF